MGQIFLPLLSKISEVYSYCAQWSACNKLLFKLSYEFKKFVNAKMLSLMAPDYSECNCRVCVFHVAYDFIFLFALSCLPFLAMLFY